MRKGILASLLSTTPIFYACGPGCEGVERLARLSPRWFAPTLTPKFGSPPCSLAMAIASSPGGPASFRSNLAGNSAKARSRPPSRGIRIRSSSSPPATSCASTPTASRASFTCASRGNTPSDRRELGRFPKPVRCRVLLRLL